jgi:hypothetical protein
MMGGGLFTFLHGFLNGSTMLGSDAAIAAKLFRISCQ